MTSNTKRNQPKYLKNENIGRRILFRVTQHKVSTNNKGLKRLAILKSQDIPDDNYIYINVWS